MRVDFTHEMRVSAAPERVFPLLCPVREHDWVQGWTATIVHSRSGVAEPGCVFVTPGAVGQPPVTWVVHTHEPSIRVAFALLQPGLFVELLDIRLAPAALDATTLTWSRRITSLSPEGDKVVAQRTSGYAERHRDLARALAHYLATGSCLRE